MKKNYAIILASGKGERFGENVPKQLLKIKNKTVLEYSVGAFNKNQNIDGIIIVANPSFFESICEMFRVGGYDKILKIVKGGKTRFDSSKIGIDTIIDGNSNLLMHDAVRPLISQEIINNCIYQLKFHKAVTVALQTTQTIYELSKKGTIQSIPDRESVFLAQTPQCFDTKIIKKAYETAIKNNDTDFTDDCSLIHKYQLAQIKIVSGDRNNLKITFPMDLEIIKLFKNKC